MRRVACLVTALALGLTACAPESEDEKTTPSPLPGYEVATAKVAPTAPSVIDLDPGMLSTKLHGRSVRLIDIRRADEIASGVIPGAEHIPMESFDPAAVTASDDRPIILYCRSGRRTRIVGEKLAAHAGEPAVHLEGGIIAWREAGYPVVTPD